MLCFALVPLSWAPGPVHLSPGLAPPLDPLLTWCHQHRPGPEGQQTLPGLLAYQQPSEPLAHLDAFQRRCADGVRGQGWFPAVSWFLGVFIAEHPHLQSRLALLADSYCTILELRD